MVNGNMVHTIKKYENLKIDIIPTENKARKIMLAEKIFKKVEKGKK